MNIRVYPIFLASLLDLSCGSSKPAFQLSESRALDNFSMTPEAISARVQELQALDSAYRQTAIAEVIRLNGVVKTALAEIKSAVEEMASDGATQDELSCFVQQRGQAVTDIYFADHNRHMANVTMQMARFKSSVDFYVTLDSDDEHCVH